MAPFHYAPCSAVVAAIPAERQRHVVAVIPAGQRRVVIPERHVAEWHRALAASIHGPRVLRGFLSHAGTVVQAVADIDSDAHTEARVVEPSLDANETISVDKVADISVGQFGEDGHHLFGQRQPISAAAVAAVAAVAVAVAADTAAGGSSAGCLGHAASV